VKLELKTFAPRKITIVKTETLGLVRPAPADRWRGTRRSKYFSREPPAALSSYSYPHILVLLSQCWATTHGQGSQGWASLLAHGALLAEVRRCSQGSSSSAVRNRAPRVGAAVRSLRRPRPELTSAEAEPACAGVELLAPWVKLVAGDIGHRTPPCDVGCCVEGGRRALMLGVANIKF
jgi:hypothetical protein